MLRDWVLFANVCLAWFRGFGVGYDTVRGWIPALVPDGFKANLGATLDALVATKPDRTCYVFSPIPRGMDVSDARTRKQPYPLFGKSKEAASYTLQQLMRVNIPVSRPPCLVPNVNPADYNGRGFSESPQGSSASSWVHWRLGDRSQDGGPSRLRQHAVV